MLIFIVKAVISGLIADLVGEIARRCPSWGGLAASLPLTSIMAMVLLWQDTREEAHVEGLSTPRLGMKL